MTQQGHILWKDEEQPQQAADHDQAMSDAPHTRAIPFTTLYRRHVRRIYAYCYRRTGNHADAEDLTEQVFTEALEKYDDDGRPGKTAAWLFTLAHSRVVDYYRRQNHRRHQSLDHAPDQPAGREPPPTPERQLIDAERRQQLFALLDTLDQDQRELILLRFGAELSFREIGDIVGKSEAAAKMALYRLLQELRALWHLHDSQESATEEDHD